LVHLLGQCACRQAECEFACFDSVVGAVLQTLAGESNDVRSGGYGIEKGVGREIDVPIPVLAADPADRARRYDGLERIEWKAVRLFSGIKQDVSLYLQIVDDSLSRR